MTTRPPEQTPDGASGGAFGEWSAWDAIEGEQRHSRLGELAQPRNVLLLSMVIIGLLALLYLHAASQVAAANSQLQLEHAQHLRLERQDQQLHLQLGKATSPAYIDHAARALGLSPSAGTQP